MSSRADALKSTAIDGVLERDVPLAPLTTLQLGGNARYFLRVADEATLIDALRWAKAEGQPVSLLGGGSNVVVSDQGFEGLVLALATRGVRFEAGEGALVHVTAQAGEPWDALVAACVAQDLAGIECLSGIPGLVGAVPVQNVGAYGQEVSDTITSVHVLDRATLQRHTLSAKQCAFAYRRSVFKQDPDRYVVLSVGFALQRFGPPRVRYAELEKALAAEHATPSLAQVRDAVIALRRNKSMVLDDDDPNRRSAGSFFENPIVTSAKADDVRARALSLGLLQDGAELPRYPQPDGRVKLAAGWLIERSGTRKGERMGAIGISSRHALALVHHGNGSTTELVAFAKQVQARVRDLFGVALSPEPVFVGFSRPPLMPR